jgi:hypothetical protein
VQLHGLNAGLVDRAQNPSTGSFTNTPTVVTPAGNAAMMSAALSRSIALGLRGQNTKPSAVAPLCTAWRASASLVMPHTFTNPSFTRLTSPAQFVSRSGSIRRRSG